MWTSSFWKNGPPSARDTGEITAGRPTGLDQIWSYSANHWGAERAERYIRDLTAAGQAVAEGRRQGRPLDGVRAGYWKLAVGSHLPCYRLAQDEGIEVVRILHQRMDVMTHIRRSFTGK